MLKKLIEYLLLSGYILLPALHTFAAVDRIGAQWFYLAVLNFFGLVYTYFNFDISFFKRNFLKFKSPLFLISATILWMLLSTIKAVNFIESTVILSRWINVLLGLIIVVLILRRQKNYLEVTVYLLSGFAILETTVTMLQFTEVFGSLNQTTRNTLLGFAANKNINAASIVFKLPFLILLFRKIKFPLVRIASILYIILGIISIILIGARSMILALLVMYTILLGHVLLKFFENKSSKRLIQNTATIFLPFLIGVLLSNILIKNSSLTLNTNLERIVEYGSTQSATDRLRYFNQAITNFFENPILGSGIGNWKIVSLKYDSLNMSNYIVQFNVHNDFLELLAEIGIGGLLYSSIFVVMFLSLINWFFKNKERWTYLIIGLSCMVYFIDSSLNFPMMRVITQVNFIFLLALFILIQDRIDHVEK